MRNCATDRVRPGTLPRHWLAWLLACLPAWSLSAAPPPELDADPHRNALGFFDIHLCNWPERPHFFKVLFSTEHFDRVDGMRVYDPQGGLLTELDKAKYMRLVRKGRPEKRVFMLDLDLPPEPVAGWYRIEITDDTGAVHEARDLVPLTRIRRAAGMRPADEAEAVAMPVVLSWKPVPGARHYQVFVRDAWEDRLVFKTPLIQDTQVKVPADLLEPGGYYSWVIHSRDLNEHVLLGDFHNGSMSRKAHFSVAD